MTARAHAPALALVAGAGAAALVACAAAKAPAPAAHSPAHDVTAPPLAGRPDELRERIRQLDADIAAALATADLGAPDAAAVEATASVPLADLRTTCERSSRQLCQDVCRLGDSICDNASAICELADQLPGDAWAAERCSAGKASCKRASERCCTC